MWSCGPAQSPRDPSLFLSRTRQTEFLLTENKNLKMLLENNREERVEYSRTKNTNIKDMSENCYVFGSNKFPCSKNAKLDLDLFRDE